MKKSMSLLVALISVLFLLCSCTRQESIDPFEYCKRYNADFGKNKINYESFFREDKDDGCYYSYIYIGEKTALATISVNEDNTVTGIALTITNEKLSFSDEELKDCFNTYIELSAVLSGNEPDKMREILNKCEITENDIAFQDISCSEESEQLEFTLLENSAIITMYTDKILN